MEQITIGDLKNGDQLFQRNSFNLKDINTYMSPIVYFGINFWPRINKTEIIPANHCGTLYFVEGEWFVYEAKLKFKKTSLLSKIDNKDITSIFIKRYDTLTCLGVSNMLLVAENLIITAIFIKRYDTLTPLGVSNMLLVAENLIGTKYDFWSILKQVFRKLFNNNIDLETNPNKYKNKNVNCSESNAMQLQVAGIGFWNTKSVGPDDLWLDKRSNLIGNLK